MGWSATDVVDGLLLSAKIEHKEYPAELHIPRDLFEFYRKERIAFQMSIGSMIPVFMPSSGELFDLEIAQALDGPHGVRLIPRDERPNEQNVPPRE